MKYKVISFVLLACISFSTFSIKSSANEIPNENSVVNSYNYLQCDYDTREITEYHAPMDNQINETWELFDAQAVSNMSDIANSFVDVAPNISPMTILGEDNRFLSPPTAAPYSAVACLVATFDTGGDGIADSIAYGTGFLVSKNVLVTAAHCLIPKDTSSSTLIDLKIYFNLHDDTLNGYSYEHPRRWTWSVNWHDNANGWQYDYCVIELHNDISRPYYFNCISSSNASTPQNIYASGYPGDNKHYQMTSYGQLTQTTYYSCQYNNDILPGMSGGPLNNANCIGIITYQASAFNQGNLFTPYLYNLICSKISDNQ